MGDVPFENLMFLWYDEENGSFVDDELYLGDLACGYEICYEDGELVHYREDAEWKNIDNWECITIGGTSVDGNERFGGI